MANIKSAKKRILVNQAKTEENKRLKTNLKTVLKKAEAAIETNAADKGCGGETGGEKNRSGLRQRHSEKEYRFQKEIQTGFACKQSQRLIFHFAQTAAGYVSIPAFCFEKVPL